MERDQAEGISDQRRCCLLRRRAVSRAMRVAAVCGLAIGSLVLIDGAAAATTGGYPFANAVCEWGTVGGQHCTNPSNASDLYDWGYWDGSTFKPFDQWGYEYRNCTSYVAWRLSSIGVSSSLFENLGNADTWLANTRGKPGVTVNRTPSPDAVAVWNSPGVGHVAWVESVRSGKVTVSDYNHAGTGIYDEHPISSSPSGYIHFAGATATWHAWEKVATGLTAGPAVSSWAANRLDVFWVGRDSHLWHMYWNGAWHPAENLGGSLKGSVSAVSWGVNRIDVLGEGTDGNLWHKWWG